MIDTGEMKMMNKYVIASMMVVCVLAFMAGTSTGDMDISDVSVDLLEQEIRSNETAEYTIGFNVTYSGTGDDETDIEAFLNSPANGWHHSAAPSLIHVDAEDRYYITIEVSANSSATNGSVFETRVLIDNSNGSAPDTIYLNTTFNQSDVHREVEVVFTGNNQDGDPGDKLSFGFSVENKGDDHDDIEVRIQETEDPGSLINPGEIGWVELTDFNKTATSMIVLENLEPRKLIPMDLIITIPGDFKQAEAGIYSYNVSVKSSNDKSTIVSREIRVEVNEMYDLELSITPSEGTRELDPTGTDGDEKIDYTIRLKNKGNSKERITVATERLGSDIEAKFDGQTQYNTPELDPDESASVTLEVEGAQNYDEGVYTFTVLARGSGDAEERVDLTVRLLKGDLRIGEITIDNENGLVEGDDTVVTVELENRGSSEITDLDIIFVVNNKEIDTKTDEIIAENDTIEVSFDWDRIEKGKQTIEIKTEDPDGDFEEDKIKVLTVPKKEREDDTPGFDMIPITVAMIVGFILIGFKRRKQ